MSIILTFIKKVSALSHNGKKDALFFVFALGLPDNYYFWLLINY